MYRILIIEDEPALQQILKDAFEKEQFEVILASKGNQATIQTAKTHPDVIILDIMLPGGMNGFDLLEQFKSNQQTKDIPIIILTNIDSEEKVAKEVGASSYFIKSNTSIKQIVKKVKELVHEIHPYQKN